VPAAWDAAPASAPTSCPVVGHCGSWRLLRGCAVRVDVLGTLLVACDRHRYAAVRRLATAATESVGVGRVTVVTDAASTRNEWS
jgi:hypothetical protein